MWDHAAPVRPSIPGSVVAVVVLISIIAVVELFEGVRLITVGGADPTVFSGWSQDSPPILGIVMVATAVVMALVAIGLFRGSRTVQVVASVLIVGKLLLSPIAFHQIGATQQISVPISIVISLVLLGLLWSSSADAYFRGEAGPKVQR